MIARVSLTIAVALLAAGAAGASSGWHSVEIERSSGSIRASVAYDVRADRKFKDLSDYRRLTLVIRRAGQIAVDKQLHGAVAAPPTLELRDVWGSGDPEALVEIPTVGNLCCDRLELGLIDAGEPGRVLEHDFPTYGWHERRVRGTVYFVTSDWRFICAFTDCADGAAPVEVFAIDKTGQRFVDVTRSRPDLVVADASAQLKRYSGERGNVGVLAAWCADEYLLGQEERCDRRLSAELARGSLRDAYPSGGRGFIDDLHSSLAKWGYKAS